VSATAPPPAPAPPLQAKGLDPTRTRAWLTALGAVLLVLLYVVVELVYSSTHLPPARYEPVAPGESAVVRGAEFRVLSLRTTERWGTDGTQPGSAEPGAVWVVAQLEVTPREKRDYLLCTMDLVSTEGRAWEAVGIGPSHEGESCAPEPDAAQIGTTYPFVLGFEVPASDVGKVAGLAVDTYSWRPYPLLRPPA
jgi:hypothetical protein